MNQNEGLPLIKFMMLLGSMSPLFFLLGVRGLDVEIPDKYLWITVGGLIFIPYIFIRIRLYFAQKSNDKFILDVSCSKDNKEYLFTYLFTVLLPLYSIDIDDIRDFYAVLCALVIIFFVLWNMNLHFINILFALRGYKVFTIESHNSSILLTKRSRIPETLQQISVFRLSNSVFIEI
jgi:hypothetical protein